MIHVRSNYSLLRGGSTLAELIRRAKELGLPWLALTDDEGLYAAVWFWRMCRKAGLHPVLGAKAGPALFLIRNRAGWSNLCRILTKQKCGEAWSIPEHQEGLHVLLEDPELALSLRGRVDRLWLELVRPGRSLLHERRLLETGLPVVASNDVHFATPDAFRVHRLLSAIRENTLVSQLTAVADSGSYLRTDLFEDLPEAVANANRIAEDCVWDFLPARKVFPKFSVPEGETSFHHLYKQCHRGLEWRYRPISSEAIERLARELRVIERLGYVDYFLVAWDIVRHSREMGVPVAGRGSGASSIVAYVLGITNVCPLAFQLPFERFLHEERRDYPDLDIDFCWRVRDDILDYVFERYKNVAMVSTHITLQPRSAFREAAKALGFSNDQVTKLQRKYLRVGEVRGPKWIRPVLAGAEAIRGFPRHLSVHPGGVVMAPEPISTYAPIQPAEKGVLVTQFEKDCVEEIGLVKLDLLGNRALSTIRETVSILGGKPDVERLPPEDPKTIAVLREARTVGCNQLESPPMRNLLRMMRPGNARDVMKALALIRPGAASLGMKEKFVRRMRGLDPPDERLGELLRDTYGIMLYEDDAMRVAATLAGMSLSEGDRFRKSVQKCRTDEDRLRLSHEFLEKCVRNGTPLGIAKDLWVQMAKFNSFSFCKAHAASYGVLAYASAYLKAHHPLAHWVAALNNNQGLYERRVYIEEAKRQGIPTRLPCVHKSGVEFTAENGSIRVGLSQIRGLEEREIGSILENRPYESLPDFLGRTKISQPSARNLILCGALDWTGIPRPQMGMAARAKGRGDVPPIPDFTEEEKFRYELALLELSARKHILSYFRPWLPRFPHDSRSLKPGRRVRLAGIMATARITVTQREEAMEFLTLEDEHGLFEVTLFPDVFRRHRRLTGTMGPYGVDGGVESQYDAVTIAARRISTLADKVE